MWSQIPLSQFRGTSFTEPSTYGHKIALGLFSPLIVTLLTDVFILHWSPLYFLDSLGTIKKIAITFGAKHCDDYLGY